MKLKIRLTGPKKPSVSFTQEDAEDIRRAMKILDEMDEPKKKRSLGSEIMELLEQLEKGQ